MAPSYFGITGFIHGAQVDMVLSSLPASMPRRLMVGVLASTKTLAGISTRKPHRSPAPAEIGSIFSADPRCLNLIHYHPEPAAHWVEEMSRLVDFGGKNLHGFQINAVWPSRTRLLAFRRAYPHLQIVLQLPEAAVKQADGFDSPSYHGTASWASAYVIEGLVDHLLIDPSGGEGLSFDPVQGLERVRELRRACGENVGIGIAGGLRANNMTRLVEPFLLHDPTLSWDAEGGLRTEEDYLDIEAAKTYAQASLALAIRAAESPKI